MNSEDLYIYDYKMRSDIISDNVHEALKILYNNAFPHVDFDTEIINKCNEIRKEASDKHIDIDNAFRYTDPATGKTYLYPLDFYYVPIKFQYMVIDNLASAFGINSEWKSDIDTLKDYLNNVDNRACIEVYTKDKNGISQREYKHINDIKTELSKIIQDNDKLEQVYNKIFEYIDNCQKFYKFGLIDENQFRAGIAFHSPNSNRETVKNAWKDIFNKDIEIPDDDNWTDIYDERLNKFDV